MEIVKKAQAGSFESSDVLVLIEPVEKGTGRKIEVDSAVQRQYGDQILTIIQESLDEYEVNDIHLVFNDKGAIDTVIKARLETAIKRASNAQKGTMY
ncbi:MAG: citrate lyase acyl carrier protein [Porphyromonadaceae bacterium CG2_30_38_12]|nr:MAG: citrate lyase acyl carrier protein [Porphyromonadaceae bacterium CG2_30_38_12]